MFTIGKNNRQTVNPLKDYKDGATLDIVTLKPIKNVNGYAVALTDITLNDEKDIERMIERLQDISKTINKTCYIGY